MAPEKPPTGSPLKRYLIGQFGNPHGVAGRLAGWFMSRRQSNVIRNRRTVELLELAPGMRVLEIGYGPGLALEQVCVAIGEEGQAFGIDRSDEMRQMALNRNREAARAGRLSLFNGSVEDASFDAIADASGPYDRIFAVNVVMFWKDPVAVLTRLGKHLADDGRVVLTLQPRLGDVSKAGAMAAAERIEGQMVAAGLADVRTETIEEVEPMAICVIGGK